MQTLRGPALLVTVLAGALAGCGGSISATATEPPCSGTAASCADGPANTALPAAETTTDLAALNGYLNAVSRADCSTAEKYALRSAFVNGDFCAGTAVGPLAIDQWRHPVKRPSVAGTTLYELDVRVSKTQDGTAPGWRTRFLTIQKLGPYFYVASVATGP